MESIIIIPHSHIEHTLKNILYVFRGLLDLSYQYYYTKGQDHNSIQLTLETFPFYEEIDAPKIVIFIQGKLTMFDPPMFGHIPIFLT